MESPVYHQWQQWENRVSEWLNQSDDYFELSDTTPFDRVILTILTIKYRLLYQDMDEENRFTTAKQTDGRISTVRLFKIRTSDMQIKEESHRMREKLFDDFAGRLLTPEQVQTETSIEWQELNQLCDWHGVEFLTRFKRSIPRFISELIGTTIAYQELIQEPRRHSPVSEVNSQVFQAKNEGATFLSVDMKSANYSMLKYINALDAQMYPTWSDFLQTFVGSKPLFLQSKILRMYCLGKLPQYHKLQALWTWYTGNIYRTILCRCFDEKEIDVRCAALTNDEVVFHMDSSIKADKVIDLAEYIRKALIKESPLVTFSVQPYRIQAFHWRRKHKCFARMFLDENEKKFDLKCVPDKDKNYDQAYQDFCSSINV
ncbi:hypothetical protein I4U23_003576 [Adineta vaga]|nr:hypothetical protein I4U23_003576 [Adineta vaga]